MALAYDAPDEAQLTAEQDQAAREDKLVRLLKSYEEDALGYAQSEIVQQQIEALQRYFGELYGDEEDGRSQVTTREVFEGIEWTRPDLMRVFASGGNIVTLEETQPEDAKYAKDAADYLAWMFFSDNPGFELLDDFAFDGLLHRRGYLAVYWRDKEYQAPQTLTGLNIQHVQMLMADPQVEIIGQDFDGESETGGITLMVRRLKSPARAEIESVAPEDMRLNGRAVTIDKAAYVGRVIRMLRGEAAKEWPDKRNEIWGFRSADAGTTGAVRRSEDVRQERFQDDRNDIWRSKAQGDDASTEIEVLEEYLRVDLNEDGYPETIRSYRLGDTILEESEVSENPFATWTPVRIPHRFMGLSYHEQLADLQRQSTVITRAGLDALYQSVVNREAYDKNSVDLESLLATYSGAKVAVDGSPSDKILPLVGGLNTATVAWDALEIIKQRIEDRTGASRQTRGLDSDQLTKEHSGVALRQLNVNGDARKEMVARNMATGLGGLFSKLYRTVCRNQNEARQAKVGGKWCQFDPRTWNSDLRVSIYSGGVNREQTAMGLQMIGVEQDKVIAELGPMNPNVTPQNRYRYQEELCRLGGFKSAEPFFSEVPEDWQPPEQEDPAMAKVKADAQAKQAEMQLKGQETAANLQLQQQKDNATLEQQAAKAALDLQLAREKAAAEIALAREKAAAEIELAWAKFEEEKALAREKLSAEMELARMNAANDREKHSEQIASDEAKHTEQVEADVKISKNREGGSLSE